MPTGNWPGSWPTAAVLPDTLEVADTRDPAVTADPGASDTPDGRPTGGVFHVHLENFQGPFDLLLSLISKHKLDVTELALAVVTDEFIAHIRAAQDHWDLDQASSFVLVAATLLDLKAARLLPSGEVDDEEDLALLEARDLLFARLLQYRAYRKVADELLERAEAQSLRFPRRVTWDPTAQAALPELVINFGPTRLAELMANVLSRKPKEPERVGLGHLHAPTVSVKEQVQVLGDRLRTAGQLSFAELIADADTTMMVVARFLAVLEMYRESLVLIDQEQSFGEMMVHWAPGPTDSVREVTTDFDASDE